VKIAAEVMYEYAQKLKKEESKGKAAATTAREETRQDEVEEGQEEGGVFVPSLFVTELEEELTKRFPEEVCIGSVH
jgi:hypothetical protein